LSRTIVPKKLRQPLRRIHDGVKGVGFVVHAARRRKVHECAPRERSRFAGKLEAFRAHKAAIARVFSATTLTNPAKPDYSARSKTAASLVAQQAATTPTRVRQVVGRVW
jgi:hypothetical protein